MSSKQYHWLFQQRVRDRKAERWTKAFEDEAKADRNNRNLYVRMPSDMGENWLDYIHHRNKMLKKGIDVYTTDKYTRLSLDKYIISNRVCDNIAGMVTNHKSCLVHFGNAAIAPNRQMQNARVVQKVFEMPHQYS